MCVHLCNCKFDGLIFMVNLDFKTSWKMFIQRREYVTRSTSRAASHGFWLSLGRHRTKGFDQISIIMGISSPRVFSTLHQCLT